MRVIVGESRRSIWWSTTAFALVACSDGEGRAPPLSDAPATTTPAQETVPTTPTPTVPRHVCDELTAGDLARWYRWPARTVTTVTGGCDVDLVGGTTISIRAGHPDDFASRLADLATKTDLDEPFDPDEPYDRLFFADERSTGALATNGTDVVTVEHLHGSTDVRKWDGTIDDAAAFFAERLRPEHVDAYSDLLSELRPEKAESCHASFAALTSDLRAQLTIRSHLAGITETTTLAGSTSIGGEVTGRVEFGSNLGANRCTDVWSEPYERLERSWPVTAGTISYQFEPSTSACLDATITATDLIAVRPDGSKVVLPDLTIRNLNFGYYHPEGCIYDVY